MEKVSTPSRRIRSNRLQHSAPRVEPSLHHQEPNAFVCMNVPSWGSGDHVAQTIDFFARKLSHRAFHSVGGNAPGELEAGL